MPKPFEAYNKQMGGVDLFDQFVSTHCSQFALGQKIGMLEFHREFVVTILASFGRNKPAKACSVKLDTKNHIILKGTSEYCRCKHCGGRSICLCQKCNVALHSDCFKNILHEIHN